MIAMNHSRPVHHIYGLARHSHSRGTRLARASKFDAKQVVEQQRLLDHTGFSAAQSKALVHFVSVAVEPLATMEALDRFEQKLDKVELKLEQKLDKVTRQS